MFATLDGIASWQVGDRAIFDGSIWNQLADPNSVSSVNGFVGAVNLDTDDIGEGASNFYYLESRVDNNSNVAANTAVRHSHSNINILESIISSGSGQVIEIVERNRIPVQDEKNALLGILKSICSIYTLLIVENDGESCSPSNTTTIEGNGAGVFSMSSKTFLNLSLPFTRYISFAFMQ